MGSPTNGQKEDMTMMDLLDLQLFAEGGGASGGAGAGAGAGEGAGVTGQGAAAPVQTRAKRENPLANVKYGVQPEQDQSAGQVAAAEEQQDQGQAAPQEESFEALIKGKYKQDYDKSVQAIIKERLKNSKQAEAALQGLTPMLQALAEKNGMEGFDASNAEMLKALSDRVTNDDSLYEEEASRRGMEVSTLKQLKALERRNQELTQREEQDRQVQAIQQHLQQLVTQGQQVKSIYPSFDLQQELDTNPAFLRLTSPEVGIDVRTAYEITHKDEIMAGSMQYAVQRTQQQMAQAVQAQGRRPMENGMVSTPPTDVKPDPSKWTKADRAEVRRRVAAGEKIVL